MPAPLPNSCITGEYVEGQDGWSASMNTNLRLIDALMHIGIDGFVATEPGSPANGDRYILNTTQIIAYDGGWNYFAVKKGMQAFDFNALKLYHYDGTQWLEFDDLGSTPKIDASTGPADAGKVVLTDSNGLIDDSFFASSIAKLKVTNNTAFTIPNGTRTSIPYNTTVEDSEGGYNSINGEYTVSVDGTYYVNAGIQLLVGEDPFDIELDLFVNVNATDYRASRNQNINAIVSLTAGDVIRIEAQHATLDRDLLSDPLYNYFELQRISG